MSSNTATARKIAVLVPAQPLPATSSPPTFSAGLFSGSAVARREVPCSCIASRTLSLRLLLVKLRQTPRLVTRVTTKLGHLHLHSPNLKSCQASVLIRQTIPSEV